MTKKRLVLLCLALLITGGVWFVMQDVVPCEGCTWQFRTRTFGGAKLASAEVLKNTNGLASFNAASTDGGKTVNYAVIKWALPGKPVVKLTVAEENGLVGAKVGAVLFVEQAHGSLQEILQTARKIWDDIKAGQDPDSETKEKIKRFLFKQTYHPEWIEAVPEGGGGIII